MTLHTNFFFLDAEHFAAANRNPADLAVGQPSQHSSLHHHQHRH